MPSNAWCHFWAGNNSLFCCLPSFKQKYDVAMKSTLCVSHQRLHVWHVVLTIFNWLFDCVFFWWIHTCSSELTWCHCNVNHRHGLQNSMCHTIYINCEPLVLTIYCNYIISPRPEITSPSLHIMKKPEWFE